MGNLVSLTVTPENQAEILQAAADAQAPSTGTPVAEAPAEPVAAPEVTLDPSKPAEGLEIKEPTAEAVAEVTDGLDMDAYYAEYAASGELSEASTKAIVDALKAAKFKNPEAALAQYIAGAKAQAQLTNQEAFNLVGGEAEYRAMLSWASTTLSPTEQAAFNAAIGTPTFQLAVRGLHAQFKGTPAGAPKQNPRVAAGANTSTSYAPIRSLEQIAELTGDPRFDRDPAFRADVENRIKASMAAGLI